MSVKHPESLVDLSGCAGKRELTQRASPGGSGWLPAAERQGRVLQGYQLLKVCFFFP